MKSSGKSIASELRRAICRAEKKGKTRYKIAQLSGIQRSQMSRIADGENVPNLNTAEKILRAIGLRLMIVPDVAN